MDHHDQPHDCNQHDCKGTTYCAFRLAPKPDASPDAPERFADALRDHVQRGPGGLDAYRSHVRELAEAHGLQVEFEATPGELPEPWRSLFGARHHRAYQAGKWGELGYLATDCWLLAVPLEVVARARAAGFVERDLAADILVPEGEPVAIPSFGQDEAFVKIGGQHFDREPLEHMVAQGATHGYLLSRKRTLGARTLYVPNIGALAPVVVVDTLREAAVAMARKLFDPRAVRPAIADLEEVVAAVKAAIAAEREVTGLSASAKRTFAWAHGHASRWIGTEATPVEVGWLCQLVQTRLRYLEALAAAAVETAHRLAAHVVASPIDRERTAILLDVAAALTAGEEPKDATPIQVAEAQAVVQDFARRPGMGPGSEELPQFCRWIAAELRRTAAREDTATSSSSCTEGLN